MPDKIELANRLQECIDSYTGAELEHTQSRLNFIRGVKDVIQRLQEEYGMTLRDIAAIAHKKNGEGKYTFQYIHQIVQGEPPSPALAQSLKEGLLRLEGEDNGNDDES